jgi:hypothetical protein
MKQIKQTMCFLTVDKIVVGDRLRQLDNQKVEQIAESMKTLGQIHAIRVDKKNNLIAGWHRLEAAKKLGWVEIFASISDGTPKQNQLTEFDENLMRSELSVVDRAMQLRARKAMYEEMYPETKQYSKEMMSNIRRAEINATRQNPEKKYKYEYEVYDQNGVEILLYQYEGMDIPYYLTKDEVTGIWRERTNKEYVEYYKTFPTDYRDRFPMPKLYDPRLDYDNEFDGFDILVHNDWACWNDGNPVTLKFGHPRTDKRPEIIIPEHLKAKSFAADAADKLGVSERTIRQEVAIAERISPELMEKLSTTAIADRKVDLILLSQQTPDVQEEIVQMFLSGEITKIHEYFEQNKGSVKTTKKKDNPYALDDEPKMKAKPKFDDEEDEKPQHDYDTVQMKEDIMTTLNAYSTSRSRVCQDAIKKIKNYLLTVTTIKY